jgi:hypothetical protein
MPTDKSSLIKRLWFDLHASSEVDGGQYFITDKLDSGKVTANDCEHVASQLNNKKFSKQEHLVVFATNTPLNT